MDRTPPRSAGSRHLIDLDGNATTPLYPAVLEAMRPHWLAGGNPESRHGLGRTARQAWERARETLAAGLGAHPDEVIITSGGTEANHLAIQSLAGIERGPGQIVATGLEHPAVSSALDQLANQGFEVIRDPEAVGLDGIARCEVMARAIGPFTRLATLMLANNEVGSIQPLRALVDHAAAWGLPVHTDAVQAVGRIAVNFQELGVATLAASAHKFHGPVGVGLLLARRGVTIHPLAQGGAQQSGRRPGTPPVALAVGMATALERFRAQAAERQARWESFRDQLARGLIEALGADRVEIHGPGQPTLRLPQTLNVGFHGVDGDALLMQLDLAGVAASLGSACASGATLPSPTLLAMKVSPGLLRSSVRFSFHAQTTKDDIDEALRRIVAVARGILGAADEFRVVALG